MKCSTTYTMAYDMVRIGHVSLIAFLTIVVYMMGVDNAHALSGLCVAMANKTPVIQSVSTIGILIVGVSATMGRVSMQMALTVAIGLAILNGIGTVAGYFGATTC